MSSLRAQTYGLFSCQLSAQETGQILIHLIDTRSANSTSVVLHGSRHSSLILPPPTPPHTHPPTALASPAAIVGGRA